MRIVLRTSKLVESIAKTGTQAFEDRLRIALITSKLIESIAKTGTRAFEDRLRIVLRISSAALSLNICH